MLVDTDILIDYLRGVAEASDYIEAHIDRIQVSAITVAELYQGVIDEEERVALDSLVSALRVLDATEKIAIEAGLFRRKYRSSHNVGLADCLIAATANQHALPLRTLNVKHFPMLEHVEAPYRKEG